VVVLAELSCNNAFTISHSILQLCVYTRAPSITRARDGKMDVTTIVSAMMA